MAKSKQADAEKKLTPVSRLEKYLDFMINNKPSGPPVVVSIRNM